MKRHRLIPGLFLISLGLAAGSLACGLSPVSLAIALCGYACHRFHELTGGENGGGTSTYITSGAGIPSLTVMAILYTLSMPLPVVIIAGISGTYISMSIIRSMKGQKKNLREMAGWGLNISLVLTALYAMQYHGLRGIRNTGEVLRGILRDTADPWILPVVMIVAAAGPVLFLLRGPEIRLHSHGREFYRTTGRSFPLASIWIRTAGSILLTFAVSCSGLLYLSLKPLGGIGPLVNDEPEGTAVSMALFLFLVLLAHITLPWIAAIVSLSGCVILHLCTGRYNR